MPKHTDDTSPSLSRLKLATGQRPSLSTATRSSGPSDARRDGARDGRYQGPLPFAHELAALRRCRLYRALHVAAHTGMRRGEVVGLNWSDLDLAAKPVSVVRTMPCVGRRPVEFKVETRTSRRGIDLDDTTIAHFHGWRQRLRRMALPGP